MRFDLDFDRQVAPRRSFFARLTLTAEPKLGPRFHPWGDLDDSLLRTGATVDHQIRFASARRRQKRDGDLRLKVPTGPRT